VLVGLVVVGQVLLFAIEPPDDDTQLIVGIARSQRGHPLTGNRLRESATRSLVAAREVWAVEGVTDAPRLTIRQWHERYRTDRDHRRSDHWPLVLAAAHHGLVQRADIIAIYEESDSNQGAAAKAIKRWLKVGRSVTRERGGYELDKGEPSALSKGSMLVLREVREGWERYGG
jgi:hypothetical protein